jgi:hypothetical protein
LKKIVNRESRDIGGFEKFPFMKVAIPPASPADLPPKCSPMLEVHLSKLHRTCTAANDNCIESYDRAERGEHIFGGVIAAVTVTDPKGRETTVRFTPKGNASAQNNELGQPANFKRDNVGRIIEITNPLRPQNHTHLQHRRRFD